MDYGTMYITATAANGKTCDIPVKIAAVSGGHEHTWSDFRKIDFEHHGYTKCTDPACPGVAPAFDKGSQYAVHEFVGGCTENARRAAILTILTQNIILNLLQKLPQLASQAV